MSYDQTNPPRLLRQSSVDAASGILWGAEWQLETSDDIVTVAQTASYITNAHDLRMQPTDILWIRRLSNNRLWRAIIASISPDGGGTIGSDYNLADIGQISPSEAGWDSLFAGVTGMMIRFTPGAWPKLSVSGTFSGAAVTLQGSNDSLTWTALSPPALTAAGSFKALLSTEKYIWAQPVVTGGDGTTLISVTF